MSAEGLTVPELFRWMSKNLAKAYPSGANVKEARFRWDALISPQLIETTLRELDTIIDQTALLIHRAPNEETRARREAWMQAALDCRRWVSYMDTERRLAEDSDTFNYRKASGELMSAIGAHRSALKKAGVEPEEEDQALYDVLDRMSHKRVELQKLIETTIKKGSK